MSTPRDRDAEVATELRAASLPPRVLPSFSITVVEGPDAGAAVTIDASQPSRLLVGQSPACGLRLADRQVSRRHVALEPTERGLRIVDLGSTNGTSVNGIAVSDATLRGGEDVRIGATLLRVIPLGASAGPTPGRNAFGKLLGASAAMQRLYPLCDRLAASAIPVLIEGETGTGKEVLAEALHEAGPRASGPFAVFDCTAVPPTLVESALFGHERGAFTGATSARKGVFEQADGGTLLIDEIGDLDASLQPKLLRAIERREVQRVGSSRWTRVDTRLIVATRRDLDREVAAQRFRDDLFFRIAVARIELPPLRDRTGDVGRLARAFWDRFAEPTRALPFEAFQRFESYGWPGNVRELHNAVARIAALGDLAAPLPETIADAAPPSKVGDSFEKVLALGLPLTLARERVVEDFERCYLERVLGEHGGNVAKASQASGIARRYFNLLRSRRGV